MKRTDNPWSVQNLEEFLLYCCPECDDKYESKEPFVIHAFEKHPKAKDYIELRLDGETVTAMCKSLNEQTSPFEKVDDKDDKNVDFMVINNDTENLIEQNNFNDEDSDVQQTIIIHEDQKEDQEQQKIYKCEICVETFLQKDQFTQHIRTVHKDFNSDKVKITSNETDEIDSCEICNANKMPYIVGEDIKSHVCYICGQAFGWISNFNDHMKNVHLINNSNEIEKVDESLLNSRCDHCGKNFKSLLSHLRKIPHHASPQQKLYYDLSVDNSKEKGGKKDALNNQKSFVKSNLQINQENANYICTSCNTTFSEESETINHVCDSKIKCEFCPKVFVNIHKMKKHVKNVHKCKKYTCKYCNHTLKVARELKIHIIEKHEHQNGVKCDFCTKVLASESRKKQHIAISHVKVKDHICELCPDKAYSRKSGLMDHMRENHCQNGKKEYPCEHCNKSLSTLRLLKNHMKLHLENGVHVCQFCNKSFNRAFVLKQHINIVHEGIRYQCNYCEMNYTTVANLRQHIRAIHQGLKIMCSFCFKPFNSDNCLKKHLKKMHNVKKNIIPSESKFDCEICGKSFKKINSKIMHVKRAHK